MTDHVMDHPEVKAFEEAWLAHHNGCPECQLSTRPSGACRDGRDLFDQWVRMAHVQQAAVNQEKPGGAGSA